MLVARFIGSKAEFLGVPSNEVLKTAEGTGAIPYHVPGVELTRDEELCSFDAILKNYRLQDPELQQLAAIMRGADTAKLDLAPIIGRVICDIARAICQFR